MPRAALVVAQAFMGADARIIEPRITSPGASIAVKRGELGTVRVVQVSADGLWIYIRTDFCDVRFQVDPKWGRHALAALHGASIAMPDEECMPLESEKFTVDGDTGRPKTVRKLIV